MKKTLLALALLFVSGASFAQNKTKNTVTKTPFVWESANIYFIVTDRFQNGNPSNDHQYNRNKPTGKLRGFEGGDLRGII